MVHLYSIVIYHLSLVYLIFHHQSSMLLKLTSSNQLPVTWFRLQIVTLWISDEIKQGFGEKKAIMNSIFWMSSERNKDVDDRSQIEYGPCGYATFGWLLTVGKKTSSNGSVDDSSWVTVPKGSISVIVCDIITLWIVLILL